MLDKLPGVLVSGKENLDTIVTIRGPFPAPKFTFVYEQDYYLLREGKSFYRVIDKKKNELFVDDKGKFIIPNKPNESTLYGKYKIAKGSL